jgi:hypothetical protein
METPEWPHVWLGGNHAPYVDRNSSLDPYLIRPKVVVSYGVTAGVAWSLTVYETREGPPIAGIPEFVPEPPAGTFVEFCLGGRGEYGGASFEANVQETWDFDLYGFRSGSVPDFVFYIGFVSDRTNEVAVELENQSKIILEITDQRPPWLPRFFFFFFPPARDEGEVVAKDGLGNVIQRETFFSLHPIPPGETAAISSSRHPREG